MCIPWGKTISLVKVKYHGHNFQKMAVHSSFTITFCFHIHIFVSLLCFQGQGYKKPKSKSQHRSPDRSTFRSRLGSDSDKSSDDGYGRGVPQRMGRNLSIEIKSDARPQDLYTPSDSGSEFPEYQQHGRIGMADTPSSGSQYLACYQASKC